MIWSLCKKSRVGFKQCGPSARFEQMSSRMLGAGVRRAVSSFRRYYLFPVKILTVHPWKLSLISSARLDVRRRLTHILPRGGFPSLRALELSTCISTSLIVESKYFKAVCQFGQEHGKVLHASFHILWTRVFPPAERLPIPEAACKNFHDKINDTIRFWRGLA